MEPNENNLKPQPTGGLKLMTVFIAVLALHVVVIGGFTVWHLLYPSGTDADLTADKTHKTKIVADSSIGDMPGDTTATDKSVASATTSGTMADSSSATTPADGTSPTASLATATDASSAPSDTPTAGSMPPAPASTTAAVPSTPTPPAMAEDASSAAANPPAPVAAATPAATHPAAVTPATTPDLAPPADATASADSAPAAPAVAAGTSYTVKRGDSLARIARRHHITLAALRSANNLKSDRLHIAQVLVLPDRAPKAAPADADAEALATPAPAASGPIADSATTDATPATPAPASPAVASTLTPHHAHKMVLSTHHLYTVVKGDTLTKIAKRYHTSTSAIVAANGLTNAGRLSIGQKLHIPSHEARTAEDKPILAEPHGSTRAQLANNLP